MTRQKTAESQLLSPNFSPASNGYGIKYRINVIRHSVRNSAIEHLGRDLYCALNERFLQDLSLMSHSIYVTIICARKSITNELPDRP